MGQNDGVAVARTHHALCGNEVVGISRINGNAVRALIGGCMEEPKNRSLPVVSSLPSQPHQSFVPL